MKNRMAKQKQLVVTILALTLAALLLLTACNPPNDDEGACFVATAAYGTSTAAQLDILREFRDQVLLANTVGTKMVTFYYDVSPSLASFISQHDMLRIVVRELLVDPVVFIFEVTEPMWQV